MIAINVSMSPDEVLRRLCAFGDEWRESKMPMVMRQQGFSGAKAQTQGPSFVLSMRPLRNGMNLVLRGTVVPHADGTMLRATVEEARWSRNVASGVTLAGLLTFLGIVLHDPVDRFANAMLVIVVITIAVLVRRLVMRRARISAEPRFRELLEHAISFVPTQSAG